VCRQRVGVAGVVRAIDDVPLFDVPDKLVRILDRDLAAAGIPKRDDRGRTVDVHAMRGTFASHLARAGVSPVTLKTLMRHARIETTLKHYADPALLDVAGAVEMLPAVTTASTVGVVATGTDSVALGVALNLGRSRQNVSLSGNRAAGRRQSKKPATPVQNTGITGVSSMGDIGLEPMTPSLSSGGTAFLSAANKALTASRAGRCTSRCTEKPEQRDELARVVALVAQLPGTDDERAGLLQRAVELLGSRHPRET
jgi:hypothetical protein